MKFLRRAIFLLPILLGFLADNISYAQWKNIAPNLVSPVSNNGFGYGGIKNVRGKIIIAVIGAPICLSGDDGKTWKLINAPYFGDYPFDLDMFDENNAIITSYGGMFINQDCGLTWGKAH